MSAERRVSLKNVKMGRTKMMVRAQRKFAHRASIPEPSFKGFGADKRPEPEHAAPAPMVLNPPINAAMPVRDLLDLVAFQNIHKHMNDDKPKDPIKDVRVVLKRLSPAPGSDAPDPVSLKESPPRALQVSSRNQNNLPRRPLIPSPRRSVQKRGSKFFIRKPASRSSALPDSEQIEGLKRMHLRNRTISRDWKLANIAKKIMQAKRRPRRVSVTVRKVTAAARKVSVSARKVSVRARKVSESSHRVSESSRRVSESSRRVSESSRRVSESSRRVSESPRRVNESSRRVSVSARRVSVSARRISETSTDDNQPLIYLTNNCKANNNVSTDCTPKGPLSDIPKSSPQTRKITNNPKKSLRNVSTRPTPSKSFLTKKSTASLKKKVSNVKQGKIVKRPNTKQSQALLSKAKIAKEDSDTLTAQKRKSPPQRRVTRSSFSDEDAPLTTIRGACSSNVDNSASRSKPEVKSLNSSPNKPWRPDNLELGEGIQLVEEEGTERSQLRPRRLFEDDNEAAENPPPVQISEKRSLKVDLSSATIRPRRISNLVKQQNSQNSVTRSIMKQGVNQANTLTDFVINIFNCAEENNDSRVGRSQAADDGEVDDEPEDVTTGLVDENTDHKDLSLERVKEWLVSHANQRPQANQRSRPNRGAQTEFKIPGTPAPRRRDKVLRPSPPAAPAAASPAPLSPEEEEQRKQCIAWNYKAMKNIVTDPKLIKRFCAECSRCKIMFKPQLAIPGRPPRSIASGSVSDVYDFDAERDDDPRTDVIAPYRTSRSEENQSCDIGKHAAFVKISNHPDHMEKFKEFLTLKGKKILRAATIISNNLDEGVALLPKDQTVLAEVIGILIECNASRGDQSTASLSPRPSLEGQTENDVKEIPNIKEISVKNETPVKKEVPNKKEMPNKKEVPIKKEIPIKKDIPVKKEIPNKKEIINKEQQPCASSSLRRSSSEVEIPRKRTRQSNNAAIPKSPPIPTDAGEIRESPKFFPTPEEFEEGPCKYYTKMLVKHPDVGLCGIKPPQNYKPTCNINDAQSNFKMTNQYIHRMLQRWGPATRELTAIRSIQDPKIQKSPLFEGLEVDLVKLFHTVQDENGIEAFQNDEQKWSVIAAKMGLYHRGKATLKLEKIYLKYLLAYDTLTKAERAAANTAVEKCWRARQARARARARNALWRQQRMEAGEPLSDGDGDGTERLEAVCAEAEECVIQGRFCNLNTFKKLAQQVHDIYFPSNPSPSPEEVEEQFWKIVMSGNSHACIHAASVDTSEHGYGFPADRAEPYGDHPWNPKRLSVSSTNLLSYLGPTIGVSSTTLHYGMTFTVSCWHMDPTMVPWIEYHHHGPPKIWYSISSDQADAFRAAVEALCPTAVQNKDIWLPSDICMIPPRVLRARGLRVARLVQRAGEYVMVYPNTYSACLDTGYNVTEGVYFAPHAWLDNAERVFLNLRSSCEPALFSLERLLVCMSRAPRTPPGLLRRVHAALPALLRAELGYRQRLASRSVELMSREVFQEQNKRASATSWQIQETGECLYCRCTIYLSRVIGVTEGQTGVCARHGVELFELAVAREGTAQLTNVYCIVLVSNAQIYAALDSLKSRVRGA